jgi:hypothetical protein
MPGTGKIHVEVELLLQAFDDGLVEELHAQLFS